MGAFGGLYITRTGKTLQSKTAEGKILKFSKILIGDGEISGDIEKVTSIVHLIKTINISGIKQGNEEGEPIISFIFSNTQITQSFYWKELALIATDPDTKEEKVFAYANSRNRC